MLLVRRIKAQTALVTRGNSALVAMMYILCCLAALVPLAGSISIDSPMHLAPRDFEPLQVMCRVNGFTLPAVVDTGAQVSIMTSGCAQRCRISPFIDTRFSGKAIGVGSDDVVGEIRDLQVQIGSATVSPRIAVLRGGSNSRVDFIIGMDLLKKLRSEISLKENTLRLHSVGKTHIVPFLSKAAMTEKARSEETAAVAEEADTAEHLEASASVTASDMTRARIADAVNHRHQASKKPLLNSEPTKRSDAHVSDIPVVEKCDDEDADDEEEDEGVSPGEAELVSLEGF